MVWTFSSTPSCEPMNLNKCPLGRKQAYLNPFFFPVALSLVSCLIICGIPKDVRIAGTLQKKLYQMPLTHRIAVFRIRIQLCIRPFFPWFWLILLLPGSVSRRPKWNVSGSETLQNRRKLIVHSINNKKCPLLYELREVITSKSVLPVKLFAIPKQSRLKT